MRTYQFIVGATEAGLRLDRYLAKHLPKGISRAMIQRSIREGIVRLRGQPVKAHCKLHPQDAITATFVELPAPARDIPLAPQPIALDVVYEDDELLVVNKPAGLVTHPAPGHWDGTLVNAILWHFEQQQATPRHGSGQASNKRPGLPRAGIVHRLDKDTSGLLLVAKTAQALTVLSRQLKARTIHRRYLAIVEGQVPLQTGTINMPIGRHLVHRKEMTVRHLGGRTAVTHYRVLARRAAPRSTLQASRSNPELAACSLQPAALPYTVLDVSLDTGRTHQIRVHMAHLGHPVVGDVTYGKRSAGYWLAEGIPRHLLHAYRLSFRHPVEGRPLTVTAPIPDDMKQWVPADIAQDLAALREDSWTEGKK